MQLLVDLNFLQLVATVFLGVVGIVFTALQGHYTRRQNTLNLHEKWDTPELSEYRAIAWDVWKTLNDGAEAPVICWLGGDYFGKTVEEINAHIPEVQTHAIRSMLNYFSSVYEYQRLRLTDRRVTRELFREPWLWWGPFFVLLQERVERHLRAKGISEERWAASSFITSLNRVSGLDRGMHRHHTGRT